MAREFCLSKASLSETIQALQQKGLLRKENATFDCRTRILTVTSHGKNAVEGGLYRRDLQLHFDALLTDKKESIFVTLLGVLQFLAEKGTIPTQRMCYTCSHFSAGKSFCKLLNKKLKIENLQIDCQDHNVA